MTFCNKPIFETQDEEDLHWMTVALQEAKLAGEHNEVPVGAVVVKERSLVSTGRNMMIATHDPSAHAEIIALRRAAEKLKNYRLTDCSLYVTLEPCLMCAGAMIHARIATIIYGAVDEKAGALHSKYTIGRDSSLNHSFIVRAGILQDQCSTLLKTFFAEKRKKRV